MKIFNLIKCNIKRLMKNKVAVILSFLLPTLLVGAMTFLNNKNVSNRESFYLVNNDAGVYGNEIVGELIKDYDIKLVSQDIAIEKLKKKTIAEFYLIDKDFSKNLKAGIKPQIKVNRRESNQSFNNIEMEFDNYVNKLVFAAIVEKASGEKVVLGDLANEKISVKAKTTNNTGLGSQLFVSMLLCFNLFCSIGMAIELAALKKERTLMRSLTTGSSPKIVIGAVLGAQFLITIVGYVALFFVYVFINNNVLINQAPIIILNLAMITALSLSLAVFISRIVKDERVIPIVLQIVLCSTCFLGGLFMPLELLPKTFTYVAKLTPQYWALQSINDGRFEYSLIVLLFAVVLFTAGTISTRSFAE